MFEDHNVQLSFPRILIIGAASLNQKTATGITMINLFLDWPLDRIAQIYDDDIQPDRCYCENYRRFSSKHIPLIKVLKRALNKFRKKKVHSLQVGNNMEAAAPSGSVSYGLFSAYSDVIPISLPDEIITWLDEYKPEIIYSLLGNVRMMNTALYLSEKYSIPIVPHFMDDWPSTAYVNSWKLYLPRLILEVKLRKIFSRSSINLTIGKDMAAEYSLRYGGKFDYFMNCVDILPETRVNIIKMDGCVRFGFVGGMHLNRWRSLITIVSMLQELKEHGNDLSVDIFSPEKDIRLYAPLFRKYDVVETMSTLMANEVSQTLKYFDILIHVESFLEEDSLYTRYSISTKIPQYMASGLPILAYGPKNLSSISYIKETGTGLVVDQEKDTDSMRHVLLALIASPDLRSRLGGRGLIVASEKHNADLERSRLRSLLVYAKKESLA